MGGYSTVCFFFSFSFALLCRQFGQADQVVDWYQGQVQGQRFGRLFGWQWGRVSEKVLLGQTDVCLFGFGVEWRRE